MEIKTDPPGGWGPMQGAGVYIEGGDPWEVLDYRGWGSMGGVEL